MARRAEIVRQIEGIWWTDEIRRTKPTPIVEARQGIKIIESSLWDRLVSGWLRVGFGLASGWLRVDFGLTSG